MFNKLEIANFRNDSFLNDFEKQNELCVKYGLFGISIYPVFLSDLSTDMPHGNIYVNIDNIIPRYEISLYKNIAESIISKYNMISGFNIPVNTNRGINKRQLGDFIDYCMFSGKNPRICLDINYLFEEYDFKMIIQQFEKIKCTDIAIFYSNKKDFDLSNMIISAAWVLKNTGMNVSLFGKFSKKVLEMPIFSEKKIRSIGGSSSNIYNILNESV